MMLILTLAAVSIIENESIIHMTKPRKNKSVTYPLRMGRELYDLVQEVTDLDPVKPSKAMVMRQALKIGLDTLLEQHEQNG